MPPPLRAAGRALLDFLYPPVCIACSAPVAEPDGLCTSCWQALVPITAPMCPVLGLPFASDMGKGAVSAEALADPPVYARARAAFAYSQMSARIVSRFKYGDHPELARFAAAAMRRAGAEFWPGNPVLVPVPLHRFRQWRRHYNQSAELARHLAHSLGLDFAPDLARRKRHTRQQVGLNAEQRRRNVAGAFAVDAGAAGRWAGRPLVLVDDVLTTGATVSALARALRRAGFDHIDVISFARVVPGLEIAEPSNI
ncbi:MAG: ComF family protein [Alphaproteobacteria bacterium]|nr:ComF family protein [Alphaproteobacteria bacterium]